VTDEFDEAEGFRAISGDAADDVVAPGRSVFGDDEVSFDDDDAAVPHWSDPPTGAVPQIGGTAESVTFSPEPMLAEADSGDIEAWAEVSSTPRWANEDESVVDQPAAVPVDDPALSDEFFTFDDGEGISTAQPDSQPQHRPQAFGAAPAGGGGRDMPIAAAVGLGLAALILASMAVAPVVALGVVTALLGLAAVEYFNVLRTAGYHPAVLLGLVSVVSLPLAVYWRGEAAMPLVLVLTVVFGFVWYVTGVTSEAPLKGLATTMLGVIHIGLLGSYAALMLSVPNSGTGLLTAAVLVTVGYDVGALAIGTTMGKSPLSAASPNKTVEGLVGGGLVAIAVGLLIGFTGQPSPFGDEAFGGGLAASLLLGASAALAAPIGDLAESLIKRDLGVKDMGSLLPGHGGLLDRFDGLLFVLPVTWYVARLVGLG